MCKAARQTHGNDTHSALRMVIVFCCAFCCACRATKQVTIAKQVTILAVLTARHARRNAPSVFVRAVSHVPAVVDLAWSNRMMTVMVVRAQVLARYTHTATTKEEIAFTRHNYIVRKKAAIKKCAEVVTEKCPKVVCQLPCQRASLSHAKHNAG